MSDPSVSLAPSGSSGAWRDRLGLDSTSVGQRVLVVGMALGSIWWLWWASQRWFIADDWSYLLYRDVLDQHSWAGIREALFTPMNGQPVVVGAIEFSLVGTIFGWGSYVPFVLVTVALHVISGVLLYRIMVRVGISDLSAALVTLVVLFLGPSTEFPALASISNFQYSLIAFLAIILILMPDGDASEMSSRRLAAGIAIGVLGSLASGFTVMFALSEFGIGVALKRSKAALAIAVPQLVLYAVWFATYGREAGGRSEESGLFEVPAWVIRITIRTFDNIGSPSFGVLVLIATVALGVATVDTQQYRRVVPWGMAITFILTLAVIGSQRAGNGVDNGAVGRYLVIMAFLVAPAVGITIDRVIAFDRRLLVVVIALVASSLTMNMTLWRTGQLFLIDASEADREALSVIAAADLSDYPHTQTVSLCSPDIRVGQIGELIERHAIKPTTGSATERRVAEQVLEPDTITGDDLRPCAPTNR